MWVWVRADLSSRVSSSLVVFINKYIADDEQSVIANHGLQLFELCPPSYNQILHFLWFLDVPVFLEIPPHLVPDFPAGGLVGDGCDGLGKLAV